MQAPLLYSIQQQHLWLSATRCIFWEEQKALILSDVHFGKTGHFRKAGIAVPQTIFKEDLQRLVTLLQYFNPVQLIVVGDFFHSSANLELELFKRWRHHFEGLKIILVKGNHDILKEAWYEEADIQVVHPCLSIADFCFTHDPAQAMDGGYTFTGHIHPGVVMRGLGKQSLRFPCFYFHQQYCILPAFSRFTGLASVDAKGGEAIFAIVNDTIIRI